MRHPPNVTRLLIVSISLLLAGSLTHCGQGVALQKELVRKLTPNEPDRFARDFIEAILAGRVDDAVQRLDPSLQTNDSLNGMRQLSVLFNGGTMKSLDVIGVNTFYKASGESMVNLVYEMHLSSGWFSGNVAVSEKAETRRITSSHFSSSSGPLEQIHAFTWRGKGLTHYLFLLLSGANLVLIFIATTLCVRSNVRRKGLWIVFILLGFMTFRLDWTTGAVNIVPLSLQLAGVSFFKSSPWSAWVIGISIPLGALLFLWRRKHLLKREPPALPAEHS